MSRGNNRNKICQSIWFQAELYLQSPLILGNGEDETTDYDLLRDLEGNPFIPGTSLAGVMRSAVTESEGLLQVQLDRIFGDSKDGSRQSVITVYDSCLIQEKEYNCVIRDGIEVHGLTKTAKNKSKYNFEVLESGACFQFRIEFLLREATRELPVLQFISNLLRCAEEGDLRIGAKTNRGYGKIGFRNCRMKNLILKDAADMRAYIHFNWDETADKEINQLPMPTYHSKYTILSVPLKVESTLLIRNYALNNLDVDCEQLTEHKKEDFLGDLEEYGRAVIPGTSWNGLIRHIADRILENTEWISRQEAQKMLRSLFGAEKDSEEKSASRIIFEESIDERQQSNANFKNVTRIKIDRFTQGVLKTALFSERVAVGGQYTLTAKIYKAREYEIGLILLAMEEILNGMEAIGGATSVGRGTFLKSGSICLNGENLPDKQKAAYWEALTEKLKGRDFHEISIGGDR